MKIADYGHLAVLEKALRQQPLTVRERRLAAHLAQVARVEKDRALSFAAFGD